MKSLVTDLRHAVRALVQRPAFSAVVVVSPGQIESLLLNLGRGLDGARGLEHPRELYAKPVLAAGVVVGIVAAWFLARLLQGLLYGVEIHDPLVFAVVPAVLALVGVLSAAPPVRRAAGVDPMTVLREE